MIEKEPRSNDLELSGLLNVPFRFHERPAVVPADVRADWRLAAALLAIKACHGGRASLNQLHVLGWAMLFPQNRQEFLRAVQERDDERLPPLVVRYDPALTRALDLGVGLGLLEWQAKNRLSLTSAGEAALAKIIAEDDLLGTEQQFLSQLDRKVSMTLVDRLIEG